MAGGAGGPIVGNEEANLPFCLVSARGGSPGCDPW